MKNCNFALMSTIFLIGYMGSGKTTLGRAAAKALGLRFIDLDDYIEEREGMSIREIFGTRGEATFRAIEREALIEVSRQADSAGSIVACGGGTPCHADNMELLKRHGVTVWLDAPHSSLLSRLKEGRDKRPLIASLSDDELSRFISTQLDQRRPYYRQAMMRLDSSRLESDGEVSDTVGMFCRLVAGYL